MKPVHITPGRGGKSTRITVEASPEDARRFLEAYQSGKLAEFGISAVQFPEHAEPTGPWTGREAQRAETTNLNKDGSVL